MSAAPLGARLAGAPPSSPVSSARALFREIADRIGITKRAAPTGDPLQNTGEREVLQHNIIELGTQAAPLFSTAHASDARRAQAWLEAQFRRAEKTGGFTLDDVEITPVMAEVMLAANTHNRKARPSAIARNVRAVTEGRWVPGASTVRFDTERTLADGQHRLTAIIAAGRPMIVDVRFGVSPRVRYVADTHGKRTGGDVLTINRHGNATALAAAARLLRNHDNGSPRANYTLENDVCAEFVNDHPGLHESVLYGLRANHALRCSTAAFAVGHYIIARSGAPEDRVREFFDRVNDGLGLTKKRDPIYVLREYITKGTFKGGVGHMAASALLGAIINAWNAHKSGKATARVTLTDGESFPSVEPWN